MLIRHFERDFWNQDLNQTRSFNRSVGVEFLPFDFISIFSSISASKSIGSTDLMNMKRRMHLISSEAKTELKQNVYRNYTKFIETAKEVSSLESEVYQLHSLLADEKQLLNTVKELLNIESKVSESSDRLMEIFEMILGRD